MRNPYQRKAASAISMGQGQAVDQYKSFIETIVTHAKIYALYDEGWALCATPTGQQSLAVWQSKGLTQLLVKDNWSRYSVQEVGLATFIETMVPFIQQNNTLLSSVHDKFHRTLILSGFCLLKIAKISLNSSFFPKPIKR